MVLTALQVDDWLQEHHPYVIDGVPEPDRVSAVEWLHENFGTPTFDRGSLRSYYPSNLSGRWMKFGIDFCFGSESDAAAFRLVWYKPDA
jgi:hypothetical protein